VVVVRRENPREGIGDVTVCCGLPNTRAEHLAKSDDSVVLVDVDVDVRCQQNQLGLVELGKGLADNLVVSQGSHRC
jgi:hypothetical protein